MAHPSHSGTPAPRRTPARPRNRRALSAALLLASLALSGCQGITTTSAQLRVIDASPDAGIIDSYQNSSALAYNLAFGTATSYIPMSAGVYNLAAEKAGTHQTLITSNETLAPNRQYTEIIGAGLANLQQTFLLDQSTPAPAGRIALRILNQTTRAGAVDVYLIPQSSPPGKGSTATSVATNLAFGANTGYLDLPEGTYALDVVPTGTTLTSSTFTLLSGAQLTYTSGAVRTIILIDQEPLSPQHPTPSVQAIFAADADAQ